MVIKERFVSALYEVENIKLKECAGEVFILSTGLPGTKLNIKFTDVTDYDFMITHGGRIGVRVELSGGRGVVINPDDVVIDIEPIAKCPEIPAIMSMKQLKSDFSRYKKNSAQLDNKAKNTMTYSMMRHILENIAKVGIDVAKMLSELDTAAKENKII